MLALFAGQSSISVLKPQTSKVPLEAEVLSSSHSEAAIEAHVTRTMILTTMGLLAALACIYELYLHTVHKRYMDLGYAIPGDFRVPIIGDLWRIVGKTKADLRNVVMSRIKEFDGIARLWVGSRLVVAVWRPKDAEAILNSQEHLDKTNEYDFFRPWLGNGLLISTGNIWRSHRKMIAPTFHQNVLRQFVDRFNANSIKTCERLAKTNGQIIDVHDHMAETTVDILIGTVMGVKSMSEKSGLKYAHAVMKMCDHLHIRHLKYWLRMEWLFNLTKMGRRQTELLGIIHSLTNAVIRTRKEDSVRAEAAAGFYADIADAKDEAVDIVTGTPGLKDDLDDDVGEKKRIAFLDLLLQASENGVVFSEKEVNDQVNTIMFEGHDTTAAASSFFLSLMGIYPEHQEKCYEELVRIFGRSNRAVTMQDTVEMKYLERCLLETLRLYPPVPVIGRVVHKETKLPSGYTLPKGASVGMIQYFIHRDPEHWEKPQEFYPDHFLPEVSARRNYYAFVPFSAGPRSCVGRKYATLKLKILLATILRNFAVESPMTEKDFQLEASIILKRSEGFQVRLVPRKSAYVKGSA